MKYKTRTRARLCKTIVNDLATFFTPLVDCGGIKKNEFSETNLLAASRPILEALKGDEEGF